MERKYRRPMKTRMNRVNTILTYKRVQSMRQPGRSARLANDTFNDCTGEQRRCHLDQHACLHRRHIGHVSSPVGQRRTVLKPNHILQQISQSARASGIPPRFRLQITNLFRITDLSFSSVRLVLHIEVLIICWCKCHIYT